MSPFKYGCTVSDEFFCPRPDLEKRLAAKPSPGASREIWNECIGAVEPLREEVPRRLASDILA